MLSLLSIEKIFKPILPLILCLCLWAGPAAAEVFDVTRMDDPVPDGCNVEDCSLREAVLAANDSGDADNEINLPMGDYQLTLEGDDDTGDLGDLDVLNNGLTVNGNGSTIDAAELSDRIFQVPTQALDLTLNDLILTGGTANGGGAVFFRGMDPNEDIFTVRRSHFHDNGGGEGGGGIAVRDAQAMVTESTISNNAAGGGGAVYAEDSIVILVNSTLSGNEGILGGGIYSEDALTALFNSTVTENHATNEGGGVFQDGGGLLIGIAFENSILAGNTADNGSQDCNRANLTDSVSSQGFNIFGDIDDCGVTLGTDDKDDVVDAGLLPLANYGGPTPTHLLEADSEALDNGDPAGCEAPVSLSTSGPLDFDQRGQNREAGGRCDSGAVELGDSDLAIEKSADLSDAAAGDEVVYTVVVTNGGPDKNFNVTLSDDLPDQAGVLGVAGSQGSCSESGGVVSCELGELDVGVEATVTMTVVLNQVGDNINTATVTGTELDADESDNSDSAVVSVVAGGGGCGISPAASSPLPSAWNALILFWALGVGSFFWIRKTVKK